MPDRWDKYVQQPPAPQPQPSLMTPKLYDKQYTQAKTPQEYQQQQKDYARGIAQWVADDEPDVRPASQRPAPRPTFGQKAGNAASDATMQPFSDQWRQDYAREIAQWYGAGMPDTRPAPAPQKPAPRPTFGQRVSAATGGMAMMPLKALSDIDRYGIYGPYHTGKDMLQAGLLAGNEGATELARGTSSDKDFAKLNPSDPNDDRKTYTGKHPFTLTGKPGWDTRTASDVGRYLYANRQPITRTLLNVPNAFDAASGGDPQTAREDLAAGNYGGALSAYLAAPTVGVAASLIHPGVGGELADLAESMPDRIANMRPAVRAAVADVGEDMQRLGGWNLTRILPRTEEMIDSDAEAGIDPGTEMLRSGVRTPLWRGSLRSQSKGARLAVDSLIGDAAHRADVNEFAAPIRSVEIAPIIRGPIQHGMSVAGGPGAIGTAPLDPYVQLEQGLSETAPGAVAPIYGPNAPETILPSDLWKTIRNIEEHIPYQGDPDAINQTRLNIRNGLQSFLEQTGPTIAPLNRQYAGLSRVINAFKYGLPPPKFNPFTSDGLQQFFLRGRFPNALASSLLYDAGGTLRSRFSDPVSAPLSPEFIPRLNLFPRRPFRVPPPSLFERKPPDDENPFRVQPKR